MPRWTFVLAPLRPVVRWTRSARRVRADGRAAAAFGHPLVHVIGDSHTAAFRHRAPFTVHHLGPTTAFKLAATDSSTGSRRGLDRALRWVRPGELVFLVFGEIDCRIHVNEQRVRRGAVGFAEIIEEIVAAYRGVVVEVARTRQVVVLGVPPASRQGNFYGYPNYADEPTRIVISRTFNEVLGARMAEVGVPIIDLSAMAAADDGLLRDDLSDDAMHYNDAIVPAMLGRLAEITGQAASAG